MEPRVTPTFFYGATTAAAVGLSLGLLLHGPWRSNEGGPRIQLSSAAAAELAGTPYEGEWAAEAAAQAQPPDDDPLLYAGYVTPAPLPLTRLAPQRYAAPEPEAETPIEAASAEAVERRGVEALLSGADASPPAVEEESAP